MVKYLFKAKKIVDQACQLADAQEKISDVRVGVHISNTLEGDPWRRLTDYIRRGMPYRVPHGNVYEISVPGGLLYSRGNELENDINDGDRYDAERWKAYALADTDHFIPPALMTLKSSPIWRDVVGIDDKVSYWSINSHGPGYLWTAKRQNGLGYYWEWIKCVANLLEFKDKTTKPIILTEVGCGEYHWALSPLDVLFLYHVHNLALGERCIAMLFYNDDLVMRLGSYKCFV